MKHKITVALCFVAVAAIGVFTGYRYHEYHDQLAAQNAKTAAVEAQSAAVKRASLDAAVKQLETQCASDKAAYALLTVSQKAKTDAPTCTTNVQL